MNRSPSPLRFESVFEPEPRDRTGKARFRIKGSGVHHTPSRAPLTHLVIKAVAAAGVPVREFSWGPPANVSSYHMEASFLDGGIRAKTGNYWIERRGAWIEGENAVAWIAHLIALTPPAATRHHRVPQASIELRNAYAATDYLVASMPEVRIRIGERLSPDLRSLLAAKGSTTATLITAWNPFSRMLSATQNRLRQFQLQHDLDAQGIEWIPAEGRDPNGIWPAEASVLALGLEKGPALELMARYQQQAAVLADAGEPAILLYLHDTGVPAMKATSDSVLLTSYWGNDDAESTIRLSHRQWRLVQDGLPFNKRGWGYYEGTRFPVEWKFQNGQFKIYGPGAMDCSEGPLEELYVE